MSAQVVSAGEMTFEEFLVAYDGVHAEWVEGKVSVAGIASDRHQDVVGFLGALFRMFVEEAGAGVVRTAPFVMRAGEKARAPDVMFVREENRGCIQPTHLEGPADLVIEVMSRESLARDRGDKFFEYEEGGVREAWFVDPHRQSVELYRPGASGTYKLAFDRTSPRLESAVLPGLWINPSWLWSDPIPTLKTVLKEWGLV